MRIASALASFRRSVRTNDAIRESAPRVDYVFETPTSNLGLRIDLEHAGEVLAQLDVDDFLASAKQRA